MSRPFAGQTVIITGAASGIGKATALKLASLGAKLALYDLSPALKDVADECTATSPSHDDTIYAEVDVSDYSSCKAMEFVTRNGQKVSHVFNCAGINPTMSKIEDTTEEYFDRQVGVNFKGVYNVTKLMIPHMKPGGSFVNVSSVLGTHPSNGAAIYCATKHAVIGFSKSVALELGPRNIRVNVVAPGDVRTPSNVSVVGGEDKVKEAESKIAMGRMGTAEEVANVVAFLMSDSASYMNGSVVEINGGVR